MKPTFLLVTMLIATALVAGTVTAQDAGNATVDVGSAEDDPCQEPEAIDSTLVLCSAELDGDTAVLVFKSDKMQRVLLTDSGAFMEGGEVPQQRVILREGEPNTVRFKVTQVDGFAGVSVTTSEVLYAVPLDDSITLIGPPWSAGDVQIAAATSAASIGSVSVVLVFYAVTGRRESPERVA